MNIDQRFSLITISRKLIIYTTKHFYLFKPFNVITQHRKLYFNYSKRLYNSFNKIST